MLERFRGVGIDIFDEWIKHVHGRQKECWLTYRISEVDIDEDKVIQINILYFDIN